MKLTALWKWVIVEPEVAPNMTPGGLHLPDNARESYIYIGRILSVGPKIEDTRLKEGVRITYQSFIDNEVLKQRMEKRTLAIKEEDVVAIVED